MACRAAAVRTYRTETTDQNGNYRERRSSIVRRFLWRFGRLVHFTRSLGGRNRRRSWLAQQ